MDDTQNAKYPRAQKLQLQGKWATCINANWKTTLHDISFYSPAFTAPYKLNNIRATCALIPRTVLLQRSMTKWNDAEEKHGEGGRQSASPLLFTSVLQTLSLPRSLMNFFASASNVLTNIHLAPKREHQKQGCSLFGCTLQSEGKEVSEGERHTVRERERKRKRERGVRKLSLCHSAKASYFSH